jgi:hypothetical protein
MQDETYAWLPGILKFHLGENHIHLNLFTLIPWMDSSNALDGQVYYGEIG